MMPKVIRISQGHSNNGMEILFYGGFPPFNIVVRMQVGSIPAHCMLSKAVALFK